MYMPVKSPYKYIKDLPWHVHYCTIYSRSLSLTFSRPSHMESFKLVIIVCLEIDPHWSTWFYIRRQYIRTNPCFFRCIRSISLLYCKPVVFAKLVLFQLKHMESQSYVISWTQVNYPFTRHAVRVFVWIIWRHNGSWHCRKFHVAYA